MVAILDADKEGFLRSESALIQTIGRAARNEHGQVIMYADAVTGSMRRAIDETKRRRAVQQDFNAKNHIPPRTIVKPVKDLIETTLVAEAAISGDEDGGKTRRRLTKKERQALVKTLTHQMREASRALEFERAAELRDMIFELEAASVGAEKKKK